MSSVAERLQKKAKRPSGTKQVRLKLVYIDFWSVVKLAFLISVAIGIITVVATFLIWAILNQTGIFDDLDALGLLRLRTQGLDKPPVVVAATLVAVRVWYVHRLAS